MMMRNDVGCNYTIEKINMSKVKYEMGEKKSGGLSLSEGNAQNITTYELVLDLSGDPFVICDHIPQDVGQQ